MAPGRRSPVHLHVVHYGRTRPLPELFKQALQCRPRPLGNHFNRPIRQISSETTEVPLARTCEDEVPEADALDTSHYNRAERHLVLLGHARTSSSAA
jgi:hypothetical protein